MYIGDGNLNILNNNPNIQNYFEILNSNGFLSPTRIANATKTCIDHVFVRHKNVDNFKTEIFDIHWSNRSLFYRW